MKHFWHGFSSKVASQVQFKKHVLVLYWEPGAAVSDETRSTFGKMALRFPSVKVKLVNVKKDPTAPVQHHVAKFPTVLLLRDGREVDRLTGGGSSLLEQLFRKAHV